ncbi:MAG: hypothetical protein CFE40_10230 [Burkholderiales bacterium PBB1]|nr:MAG: hypothetical protein CFE40_10230 [Burkholderiales bacterium PBB1]
MHPDAPVTLPRGRPPAAVLLALTLIASLMHGCVLDGMPLDGLQTPAYAALPSPTSLQVRQIAMPEADADRTSPVSHPLEPLATMPALKKARPPANLTRTAGLMDSGAPEAEVVKLETAPLATPVPTPLAALAPASAAVEASVTTLESPLLRQPERPVPVYKTRIPPLTTIEYEIRRGGLSGTGELSWRPTNGHYEARLAASIAGFTLLTQISQGGFDAAGLAPTRFTDQRVRKAARAANFQRDAGKITFSGPRDEYALAAGSQDRLSWMIQLPAVIAGEPKRAASGGEVVLYIAGARGDVDLWDLRSSGLETIETPSGALQTVKFTRTPRSARDTLAEVWLDPKRHYLPVRARLTQSDSDGALDLVLRELHTAP